MNLFDYMAERHETDIDTYDNTFDVCVTICMDVECPPEDDYERFVLAMLKLVDVVEPESKVSDAICDWAGLIERNLPIFKEFTEKNWYKNRDLEDDDFICEWIEELHLLGAGYGQDDQYGRYKAELFDRCK